MMTEEEARTRWCPFARSVNAKAASCYQAANRVAGDGPHERDMNPESARCIASECMAWRWSPKGDPLDSSVVPEGYCGLASRPEV